MSEDAEFAARFVELGLDLGSMSLDELLFEYAKWKDSYLVMQNYMQKRLDDPERREMERNLRCVLALLDRIESATRRPVKVSGRVLVPLVEADYKNQRDAQISSEVDPTVPNPAMRQDNIERNLRCTALAYANMRLPFQDSYQNIVFLKNYTKALTITPKPALARHLSFLLM